MVQSNVDTVNVITACSRPENLYKVGRSIKEALSHSSLKVVWKVVIDRLIPQTVDLSGLSSLAPLKPEFIVSEMGPSTFGIPQKNLGMEKIARGYYHCLDDDNIMHPKFLMTLHRAMVDHPTKFAFAFGQDRWDRHGPMIPTPERMVPGEIDNTMFVVHKSVIGKSRYDPGKAGLEDGFFFKELYERSPEKFAFIPDMVTYYNFLRHFV